MFREIQREIISVPDVADGNPATALALHRQAEAAGVAVDELITLSTTSAIVNRFHRGMSANPESAQKYTDESEARRVGLAARVYAGLSFREFALRLRRQAVEGPARWNVVQEHQLLGASPKALGRLSIEAVRLMTPDVLPKESGITAIGRHSAGTISVWSAFAYGELRDRGVQAELTKPYFLDGFQPNRSTFHDNGVAVVAKSSGNGMPEAWRDALEGALRHSDSAWALHTPDGLTGNVGQARQPDRTRRLELFYGDLGERTQAIIGYPSELVSVVCDMRERGAPTWLISLPPRGAHEKRNLAFAQKHDIVRAELALPGGPTEPTLPGLETVPVAKLPSLLRDLDTPPWKPGITGTKPIWSPASERNRARKLTFWRPKRSYTLLCIKHKRSEELWVEKRHEPCILWELIRHSMPPRL